MSLSKFHMLFILLAIAGADLIGGWSVREYSLTREGIWLLLAVIVFAGSFGLIGYALWLVHKFEKANIS